ncbi:hypothetical protein GCM10023322_11760 [Rugosimonospora acidiphila]|uniref:Low temperature requirement protein LtrA n=1 Tax=Rugosimonospora acidiphila TaxID=556531 RepID=A0ABP9RMX8_9ACTN
MPKRVSLLELLYDVVYVAAFALISTRLATHVTWIAAAQTLVVLLAVWWTWSSTVLLTNFYNPERMTIQAIITVTMLGVILMAVAAPSAFANHAGIFAGAYVGIHVVKGILLISALRYAEQAHARARAARFLFWFLVSGIGWIAGVFVDAPTRLVVWAAAAAVDCGAAAARYPTPLPRPGRIPTGHYEKAGEHFVERYRQIVILAIGDLILAPALRLRGTRFDLVRLAVFLVAFVIALLLWRLFVHTTAAVSVAAAGPRSGRGPRLAPYTHFGMVAGAVITTAGVELVVRRPIGATPGSWVLMILGGPALFILSRTIFEYLVLATMSRMKVGGFIALLAVSPAMVLPPPVFVTLVATAVVLGIDLTEGLRSGWRLPWRRRHPPQERGWSVTGADADRLLRDRRTPTRATLLELIFDLVYVAAFALLSIRLADHATWSGAGQTLVLLLAIWWTWSITTLLTDFYNPQQTPIRAAVTATMLGAVLMTIAIPSAFARHAWVFAGAYVGIHVVRGGLLVSALRGHRAQVRAGRFLFWFGLSGIVWIGGVLVGNPARGVLWACALAIDLLSAAVRYPTPRYGRVPLEQYDRTSEHIAERYQQVMILTLGQLVLVAALTFSGIRFDLARAIALLAVFAVMLLLWQIYAYSGGVISVLVSERKPSRGPRVTPYTHFLMVAGVVATAAGGRLVITRPTGPVPTVWVCAVLGGPALFLIGRTIFEYAFVGALSRTRLGWLVVLVAVTPPATLLPPVFISAVAVAVLTGVVGTDHLRTGGRLPRWLEPVTREG